MGVVEGGLKEMMGGVKEGEGVGEGGVKRRWLDEDERLEEGMREWMEGVVEVVEKVV